MANPLPADLDPATVRESLAAWYEADQRSFPWRETTDPYRILVSEVMSQQTQLSRVVDAYKAFVERWSTVEALADADRSAIVSFWTDYSLGYNNRAPYLHEAAGQVVYDHDRDVPETPDALHELMGTRPSPATAVPTFAFGA
mgnify:CR=1 FL=1